MAGKIEKKEKTKQKKRIEKTETNKRNTLEKLGFTQLMFDFFTAPVV